MGKRVRRVLAACVRGVVGVLDLVTGFGVGRRGPSARTDESRLRELRASGALTEDEYRRAVERVRRR